ncbi:CsbD family protein [Brackiella oedipodis]|uniref:CsbD family protein n=1 Tax=Brackiella oedipodis TaxID=124225 RepID=UPI00048E520A|nr:CsbD family protein [Brackiella oedipodis]
MNEDTLKGKWEQLKGAIKEKWGDLTDDDLTEAEGSSQKLAGRVQEKYGKTKEEAEKEVNDFLSNHKD